MPAGARLPQKEGAAVNERQRKFAEYYAQSGNAAESARKAGYSESYAEHRTDEMLRNVEISQYIKELTEKAKDERILTAKDRQIMLSDIARGEENKAADRVKAIDTLNKMTGEYITKIEGSVDVQNPFEQLTVEELRRLAND